MGNRPLLVPPGFKARLEDLLKAVGGQLSLFEEHLHPRRGKGPGGGQFAPKGGGGGGGQAAARPQAQARQARPSVAAPLKQGADSRTGSEQAAKGKQVAEEASDSWSMLSDAERRIKLSRDLPSEEVYRAADEAQRSRIAARQEADAVSAQAAMPTERAPRSRQLSADSWYRRVAADPAVGPAQKAWMAQVAAEEGRHTLLVDALASWAAAEGPPGMEAVIERAALPDYDEHPGDFAYQAQQEAPVRREPVREQAAKGKQVAEGKKLVDYAVALAEAGALNNSPEEIWGRLDRIAKQQFDQWLEQGGGQLSAMPSGPKRFAAAVNRLLANKQADGGVDTRESDEVDPDLVGRARTFMNRLETVPSSYPEDLAIRSAMHSMGYDANAQAQVVDHISAHGGLGILKEYGGLEESLADAFAIVGAYPKTE